MNSRFKFFAVIFLLLACGGLLCWITGWHKTKLSVARTGPGNPGEKGANINQEAYDRAPPVIIYGKVLDAEDDPIAGVEVVLSFQSLNFLLGLPYHSVARTESNPMGEFQIKLDKPFSAGIQSALKPGYVFIRKSASGGDLTQRKTSPDNRVVFRMRKLGIPTFVLAMPDYNINDRLTTVAAGESKSAKWSICNLRHYNSFWTSQKDVEFIANFDQETKEWEVTFRAVHPDGGILLSQKELFLAPETGYERELRFRTGRAAPDMRQTKYHLYLRTRTPMIYAKIDIKQTLGLPKNESPHDSLQIDIKSWTNPYGERNFEPLNRTVENFQAQDAHTEYCLKCINENRRADPKHLTNLLEAAKSKPATP